jgi:hypothetical protein
MRPSPDRMKRLGLRPTHRIEEAWMARRVPTIRTGLQPATGTPLRRSGGAPAP